MAQKNKKAIKDASEHQNNETNFSDEPLIDKIGSDLKRIYEDVVNEPVPDDFLSLLAKADEKSN